MYLTIFPSWPQNTVMVHGKNGIVDARITSYNVCYTKLLRISVCEHAAKTVSNAFTSAMSSAGIDVSWSRGATQSGDYCWGHFLSQCYPDRNPLDAPTIDGSGAFVQQSWSIVSQAVMREMYNPHSSDEVRFRDSDLRLRIGLNLRSASRHNDGDF